MSEFNSTADFFIWIIVMFAIYLVVGFFAIYVVPTIIELLAYNIMVMIS